MKKLSFFLIIVCTTFFGQAQISKVKYHVDRAKNSAVQMKSYLEGMSKGSKDSRNIYASRLRSKASIVRNHLDEARAKIPAYNHPKFKQKGFTSTRTHSFTNRMNNAMLNIRYKARLYRESTKNATASRHMNSIISSYNGFLNAYREFTKYAREAYKIELVVEVDERTRRNQKDNKDQSDWIRKTNNYDDNKPKTIVTKKTTKAKPTRNEIWKQMSVLRKKADPSSSIKLQNRLVTMYSGDYWFNIDLDDIDFTQSNIAYNKKDKKYYLYATTRSNKKNIITSWSSDRYNKIGVSFNSKLDALEFKALLKQLATRNYKTESKKPGNIDKSTSNILNRMNVLQKKYNPKFSVKLENGLFKGYFRPTSHYKFDLNDIDFSKSHYRFDSEHNSHDLMFYTKNEKRKIITTWGSPLYRVFTSFSNKKDALEFLSLAKQLATRKYQPINKKLTKNEVISQLKKIVANSSLRSNSKIDFTGDRIKISGNSNAEWVVFNVNEIDFTSGLVRSLPQNDFIVVLYTKKKKKSVINHKGEFTNRASWIFTSKSVAEKYSSLLKQLSKM